MFNNSSTDSASNGSDQLTEAVSGGDCTIFTFVIYVGIFGAMCLLGIIGNTLSFIVLQWERKTNPATFLLKVMAVFDNWFLAMTGLSQILSAMVNFNGTGDRLLPFVIVYVWPLVHISQMLTVWITVLIAFNRYIAICRPFQAPQLCTMRRVWLQLGLIVAFAFIYNLPRFFEYKLVFKESDERNVNGSWYAEGIETELRKEYNYNIIYENILYCLFIFLGPLVVLIYFNVCLFKELWAARERLRKRRLPTNGEEEENSLTLVMVVIVLIFLICQTPAFINQLLFYTIGDFSYFCGHAYFYYFHISNLLVSANSSLNFVVYCALRQQFRERLVTFCACHKQSLRHIGRFSHNGKTTSVYIT